MYIYICNGFIYWQRDNLKKEVKRELAPLIFSWFDRSKNTSPFLNLFFLFIVYFILSSLVEKHLYINYSSEKYVFIYFPSEICTNLIKQSIFIIIYVYKLWKWIQMFVTLWSREMRERSVAKTIIYTEPYNIGTRYLSNHCEPSYFFVI